MYELRVRQSFDAAHYIKDYEGKCSREHGHRWTVEVCIRGNALDDRNMLTDFKDVKGAMNFIFDQSLDHYQLNETLGEENVTAEYLAEWLFRQMKARAGIGLKVVSVEVWESPDCGVRYDGVS